MSGVDGADARDAVLGESRRRPLSAQFRLDRFSPSTHIAGSALTRR